MTDDLQQARISTEVLNEYRKIAAWLEAQAATRGPVGDTMHGLAAEALTNLIEHEYSRHTIPLYGMLDVWVALYGTSHPEFDEFYDEHGYAEAWSRLMAEIRSRAAVPDAAPDGQVIIPIARIHELRAAKDAALAAIERVRAINTGNNRALYGNDFEAGMAKALWLVKSALDGAPEPEGRWEYGVKWRDSQNPVWYHPYTVEEAEKNLADWPMVPGYVVRRQPAGPWLPVEGEKP